MSSIDNNSSEAPNYMLTRNGRSQRADNICQRLAFLCHDLRTFTGNAEAARRLDGSLRAHFLGPPYLSEADAEYARGRDQRTLRGAGHPEHAPSSDAKQSSEGGSPQTLGAYLEECVAKVMAARKAKGADNDEGGASRDLVLCTSHDLAPLLQEACGSTRQHFETRAFKDAYKRWEKEVRKAGQKGKGAG
ncbi:hypothetical protein BD413DRAFT_600650 [Trametes elegans]|nr:hypothetical protein BD413DRAFT_600650 [Trametes elegans]